jgi:hypothetical protein
MIIVVIYLAVIGIVFSPFLKRALRHMFLRRKAARLPDCLVDAEPDRIGSILPGKGSFLWQSEITIDKSGRVWVEPKRNLIHSPSNRDIYLKREATGWVLTVQDTLTFRRDRRRGGSARCWNPF